jgi:hypothetical protein
MKGMSHMDSQDEVSPVEGDEVRKCVLCDRVWALFGIAVGVVFLYMSIDILTGSKLTSALSLGRDSDD